MPSLLSDTLADAVCFQMHTSDYISNQFGCNNRLRRSVVFPQLLFPMINPRILFGSSGLFIRFVFPCFHEKSPLISIVNIFSYNQISLRTLPLIILIVIDFLIHRVLLYFIIPLLIPNVD